uniref:Uncharacterized protein n=1 Tax=Arundo donax TaxID=35708 RepID=A0A0A9GCL6_ARUDO
MVSLRDLMTKSSRPVSPMAPLDASRTACRVIFVPSAYSSSLSTTTSAALSSRFLDHRHSIRSITSSNRWHGCLGLFITHDFGSKNGSREHVFAGGGESGGSWCFQSRRQRRNSRTVARGLLERRR